MSAANLCPRCGQWPQNCMCGQSAEGSSELAAPPLLEPATKTPRTMRCWRDGRWHADELANLAAKLERETVELEKTINTLHGLCVSAEKRAFQKLKEEAAAAGSNDPDQRPGRQPKT